MDDFVLHGKRLKFLGKGVMGAVFLDPGQTPEAGRIYKIARLVRREFNNEVEFASGNQLKDHLLPLLDHEILNTEREKISFDFPKPRPFEFWPPELKEKWLKRMSTKYVGVLVYQFLPGTTLLDLWRQQWKQSNGARRSVVLPMLDVVTAVINIHDRGYVHRDIHSGNIMISDHRAILVDYGRVNQSGVLDDELRILSTFTPIMDSNVLEVALRWAPYKEFLAVIREFPQLAPYRQRESFRRATFTQQNRLLGEYAWLLEPELAAKASWLDVGLKSLGEDPKKWIRVVGDLSADDYLWMLDHWDDLKAIKRRLLRIKRTGNITPI